MGPEAIGVVKNIYKLYYNTHRNILEKSQVNPLSEFDTNVADALGQILKGQPTHKYTKKAIDVLDDIKKDNFYLSKAIEIKKAGINEKQEVKIERSTPKITTNPLDVYGVCGALADILSFSYRAKEYPAIRESKVLLEKIKDLVDKDISNTDVNKAREALGLLASTDAEAETLLAAFGGKDELASNTLVAEKFKNIHVYLGLIEKEFKSEEFTDKNIKSIIDYAGVIKYTLKHMLPASGTKEFVQRIIDEKKFLNGFADLAEGLTSDKKKIKDDLKEEVVNRLTAVEGLYKELTDKTLFENADFIGKVEKATEKLSSNKEALVEKIKEIYGPLREIQEILKKRSRDNIRNLNSWHMKTIIKHYEEISGIRLDEIEDPTKNVMVATVNKSLPNLSSRIGLLRESLVPSTALESERVAMKTAYGGLVFKLSEIVSSLDLLHKALEGVKLSEVTIVASNDALKKRIDQAETVTLEGESVSDDRRGLMKVLVDLGWVRPKIGDSLKAPLLALNPDFMPPDMENLRIFQARESLAEAQKHCKLELVPVMERDKNIDLYEARVVLAEKKLYANRISRSIEEGKTPVIIAKQNEKEKVLMINEIGKASRDNLLVVMVLGNEAAAQFRAFKSGGMEAVHSLDKVTTVRDIIKNGKLIQKIAHEL